MMQKKICVSVITIFLLLGSAEVWAGDVHPDLEKKLQKLTPGEKLAVIVELKEQVRPERILSSMSGITRRQRARDVVYALRDVADRSQGPLRKYLKKQTEGGAAERVIPFWIFNGIAVRASEPLIRSLASRPDVKEIRLDSLIPLPSPLPAEDNQPSQTYEWNIDLIHAPEVWALNPDYNGAGAVIGSFDTGVDLTHPDLYSRYRGNHEISWFDPYGEYSVPFDFHGHGTHTTGTAVGGNAGGSCIGVAPGATWIAAKGWDDEGMGETSAFHQIFEWFLAPGGDPDNAPDVVNSSWSFSQSGCETEFLPDVQALRAAGIFPAFASGNSGPWSGSVRSPGAYPDSFAVGATNFLDALASFSSRGPSPCDDSIKPEISAPGVGILSSCPLGYVTLSGTSMAAPHITGAVAVLKSINPALTVDQLESALTLGAKDLGDPGPDNMHGAGRLDLLLSAQIAIQGPDFPVIKVLATDALATEAGPTSGTFTINRIGNTDDDLEVTFSITGTATPGTDYDPVDESVVIQAGSATATISITPIDDTLTETDETVVLTILSDPAYLVSGTSTAKVTIESDEMMSDLDITSMSTPTTTGAGQNITITDTTKNIGGGLSEASVTQFYLSTDSTIDGSDTLLETRNIPALAAGESSTGSTQVTIPEDTAASNWYIIAKADGEDVVLEASEINNMYTRTIGIGPDLDISALSVPSASGQGQSLVITDTTKNMGGGVADSSVTQFYLSTDSSVDTSDTLLGSRNVPELVPGGYSYGSTTVTIPEETSGGSWYIVAKADGVEVVPETSENNNTYSRSIKIGSDLNITALSAPTTVSPGQNVVITDTTKNIGGGLADPSVTQFYLSLNTTVEATDTLLGSRSVPALSAGASSAGSTSVTIPEGTAAGNWYIVAKADGEEVVAETSETNNTYAWLIKTGPDLDITSLSTPTTASAGQSIVITDTTKNMGGGVAESSVTQFYLSTDSTIDGSDVLLGSRSVQALTAGASSAGSTSVTIPEGTAAGNWYIVAKADGEEVVVETSEINNTYTRTIGIGPDLNVSSISAPSTASPGKNVVITDTTRNMGGGNADSSVTEFYLSTNSTIDTSDTLLGSRSVPALSAGVYSYGSITVVIPESTSGGNWYIVAKADGGEAVPETSETNNTYSRLIKIGSDLSVTYMSVPTTAGPGQSLVITDTTKNIGGGVADPSVTQFYLSLNTTVDSSDTLLGSRNVPALGDGTSSTGSTTVTIPEGTSGGNWYVVARADGEETVPETSESNNTYARLVQIGSDLDITYMSTPLTAGPGQSIVITDTTKNIGGGIAASSLTQFYLSINSTIDTSDTLLGSRSVPALTSGAYSTGSTTVTIPEGTASGNWYIIAKADGEEVVPETSETNNTYRRTIGIGPDLDITALSAPSSASPEQSIVITDTIKNIGGGSSAASQTHFYLSANGIIDSSDILLGSRSIPVLGAGTYSYGSTTVTIPGGTAAGRWYIIAMADGEEIIVETSEYNNTYVRSINID
jgi:subtilase family serine protease